MLFPLQITLCSIAFYFLCDQTPHENLFLLNDTKRAVKTVQMLQYHLHQYME